MRKFVGFGDGSENSRGEQLARCMLRHDRLKFELPAGGVSSKVSEVVWTICFGSAG